MIIKLVIYYALLLSVCHVFIINAQNLKDKVNNAKNSIKNVDVKNVKKEIKKKLKPDNCDCGISSINETDAKQIHPWQVLLTINWKRKKAKDKNIFCQGTLISKKHIITAMHCLQERVEFSKMRKRLICCLSLFTSVISLLTMLQKRLHW